LNPIFAAAAEIEAVCRGAGFSFCFIGGLAVQRWGEPRMTADVDLTLLTGFGGEAPFVDRLLSSFRGRLDDAREFALESRTLLLYATNGTPLDVSLGAMPFEEHTIERSTGWTVAAGVALTTCSAEDLIVHKAFAGRDKDWLDIRGIVARRRGKLRAEIIWDELLPLLDLAESREPEARLRAILR
jgi:hypothetical protein